MRTQGWSFLMGVGVAAAAVGMAGLGSHAAGFRLMREPAPMACPVCPAAEPCAAAEEEDEADDEEEVSAVEVQETPLDCPTATGPVTAADAARSLAALDQGNHAILMGDFHKAIAQGTLALELDPSRIEAHKLLGVAYARVQSYCEAKVEYRTYLACNPTSSQADRIRAILHGPELQACP